MAAPKRQDEADVAAELKAWRMTFKSGYDYLRALPAIGVEISMRHRPDRELVEDAWRRLGRIYLDALFTETPETWAEREMGAPETLPRPVRARRRR